MAVFYEEPGMVVLDLFNFSGRFFFETGGFPTFAGCLGLSRRLDAGQAMLDENYFWRKLLATQVSLGDSC